MEKVPQGAAVVDLLDQAEEGLTEGVGLQGVRDATPKI
jgi:hypothetical protein